MAEGDRGAKPGVLKVNTTLLLARGVAVSYAYVSLLQSIDDDDEGEEGGLYDDDEDSFAGSMFAAPPQVRLDDEETAGLSAVPDFFS